MEGEYSPSAYSKKKEVPVNVVFYKTTAGLVSF